jgi:hypothetical protein
VPEKDAYGSGKDIYEIWTTLVATSKKWTLFKQIAGVKRIAQILGNYHNDLSY